MWCVLCLTGLRAWIKARLCPVLLRTERQKQVPTDLFINYRKYNWSISSLCSSSMHVGLDPSFAEDLRVQEEAAGARGENRSDRVSVVNCPKRGDSVQCYVVKGTHQKEAKVGLLSRQRGKLRQV